MKYKISRLQGLLDINGPLDSVIPQKLSFREGIFSTLLIVLYKRLLKSLAELHTGHFCLWQYTAELLQLVKCSVNLFVKFTVLPVYCLWHAPSTT